MVRKSPGRSVTPFGDVVEDLGVQGEAVEVFQMQRVAAEAQEVIQTTREAANAAWEEAEASEYLNSIPH
jgi:hypothetical protein